MAASLGNVRLLDLPDDVLLRVLRALMRDNGTQKAENVRDLANVTKTSRRMGKLAMQMMSALCTTRVELVEGVPHDVVTAMPHDVMNGTLLTLLIDGLFMKTLRVVRLGAMGRSQLQLALDILRTCSSVTELWFVDVPRGVMVPEEVACRLEMLSIVWVHTSTLASLYKTKCSPQRLRFSCVDRITESDLYEGWEYLARESTRGDVTWTFHRGDVIEDSADMYLPLDFGMEQVMRVRTWRRSSPFGPPIASSMRRIEDRKGGWQTVWISEWLQIAAVRAPQRQMELFGEEGLLTVVVDGPHEAHALQKNGDALLKRFVREIICSVSFDGRVDKLQILVAKFYGQEGQTTANVAARLATQAASMGGVRELTVSSSVFVAFEHVRLPTTVDSVGVVDKLVWSSFVRALPATLAALARRAAVLGKRWCVWMQMMRLGENVDALRRETLLRGALAACRRAERDGLCATGVRGTIEQWLRET